MVTTPPPSDPFGSPSGSPSSGPSGYPSGSGQGYGQPGQGYGQPGQGYGQPPAGYGPPQGQWTEGGAPKTESKAIIALVCAIGSWVLFPLLPAIAALMVGKSARRDIEASGGWLTGDGLVTAAKVIAWANIVLCLLVVVLGVLALTLFAVSSETVTVQ